VIVGELHREPREFVIAVLIRAGPRDFAQADQPAFGPCRRIREGPLRPAIGGRAFGGWIFGEDDGQAEAGRHHSHASLSVRSAAVGTIPVARQSGSQAVFVEGRIGPVAPSGLPLPHCFGVSIETVGGVVGSGTKTSSIATRSTTNWSSLQSSVSVSLVNEWS